MLATVSHAGLFDNALADAIGSLVVVLLGIGARFAPRGFRAWRYERLLMKGSKGAPGIPAVVPIGTRVGTLETGMYHANKKLDSLTATVTSLATDVTEILGQVKTNGGNSLRDAIDRIEPNATLVRQAE